MIPSVRPGRHAPLGATYDGQGVHFAVFSEHATAVELCLFDAGGAETRLPLLRGRAHVFSGYVRGLRPGQAYGFRAHGPYSPKDGHRFNPAKLLVDPYARAVTGSVDWRAPVFGYRGSPVPGMAATTAKPDDAMPDMRDDAAGVPRSIVVDDAFDWKGVRAPRVPWEDTVLYEAHVKSLTMRHPDVPPEHRGTYLGLTAPAVLEHLTKLRVTTVELMPIHASQTEWSVAARGKENYWGYSTLAFFAPDPRFATRGGDPLVEVKQMVRALHAAGIEVVLDVVYNHTCESDQLGPTLSLRGLDNATYYRLSPKNRAYYEDYTGCGNSLNMLHAQTLKLVMDSLRYWVTEVHVDGFRFDLASTLARETRDVDKMSAFFDIIHQDPVLSNVKLIAEPWDLGEGGYQVGNFPVLWTEWNGRYRDTVRRFWRGEATAVADMGYRLTGSSDLYEDDGRHPHASINFITAHDGFTLHDLVTYERKRNLPNGEDDRDGSNDNMAWNMGVEGETDDVRIRDLRARQERNLLTTLILSLGVPMLTSGDEMGKTQHGNNNAFVQDNEVSWLDWELARTERSAELLAFARELGAFRAAHPVFRRSSFLKGQRPRGGTQPDAVWFHPDGREMGAADWRSPRRATLALFLSGDAVDAVDDEGRRVVDDSFLLLLNGARDAITFVLPGPAWGDAWRIRIDTRASTFVTASATVKAGTPLVLDALTTMVLERVKP